MYESISNIELLWAIDVLETPTVNALTESLPVSKATVRRRLSTLKEAGHVDTYVTSLPKFPSAYEPTDSGYAELEAAIATPDELVYTVGDTRVYPLPPVDSIDDAAGPDSELAQYFSGRQSARSDDIMLGALARAVYQVTPPAARPDLATHSESSSDSDAASDSSSDPGTDPDADMEAGAEAEAETQTEADTEAETDAEAEADTEAVMPGEVDTPRPLAGMTATRHGDSYWGPPTPAHGDVAWWRDRIAPESDRQPPPAAPPDPHEPASDTDAAVIGLPVPPEMLRTDVWVTTTAIAGHAPYLRSTLEHHLRRLGNTGLVVARVPNRSRGAPDEGATDGRTGDDTDGEAGSAAAHRSLVDPNNPYVPGWWRLTPAGCARLAALVEDGAAAVEAAKSSSSPP
jgi:DNA-binding transcriptional ArsR family regulator